MKCTAVRNKQSFDQCSNKCLRGLIFCGKHARAKNTRLWKDVNKLDEKAILIQKCWRGFAIRQWLTLAGPGVLNRKICHNDEELVTFDERTKVHPLDYFAFEEAGKVYWFDVRSLCEASMNTINPVNPYTRAHLSTDTRQRLRKIGIRRYRRKLPTLHDPLKHLSLEETITTGWIYVCQIIGENGFFDMSPLYFSGMNRTQYFIFITLLLNDFIAWRSEHPNPGSKRGKYIIWMKRLLNEHSSGASQVRLSLLVSKVLITILNDYPEPYPVCFIIVSALHRL